MKKRFSKLLLVQVTFNAHSFFESILYQEMIKIFHIELLYRSTTKVLPLWIVTILYWQKFMRYQNNAE